MEESNKLGLSCAKHRISYSFFLAGYIVLPIPAQREGGTRSTSATVHCLHIPKWPPAGPKQPTEVFGRSHQLSANKCFDYPFNLPTTLLNPIPDGGVKKTKRNLNSKSIQAEHFRLKSCIYPFLPLKPNVHTQILNTDTYFLGLRFKC